MPLACAGTDRLIASVPLGVGHKDVLVDSRLKPTHTKSPPAPKAGSKSARGQGASKAQVPPTDALSRIAPQRPATLTSNFCRIATTGERRIATSLPVSCPILLLIGPSYSETPGKHCRIPSSPEIYHRETSTTYSLPRRQCHLANPTQAAKATPRQSPSLKSHQKQVPLRPKKPLHKTQPRQQTPLRQAKPKRRTRTRTRKRKRTMTRLQSKTSRCRGQSSQG